MSRNRAKIAPLGMARFGQSRHLTSGHMEHSTRESSPSGSLAEPLRLRLAYAIIVCFPTPPTRHGF